MRNPAPKTAAVLVNVALYMIVAGCGAVLLVAMTQWHGAVTVWQVLCFYVAPALLLAGSLVLLRRPVRDRSRVVLLLVLVGVGLVVAEGVLLVVKDRAERAAELRGRGIGRLSLYEAVEALRDREERAVPRATGGLLMSSGVTFQTVRGPVHPLSPGPGRSTIVLCNSDTGPISHSSDRHGFNNPDSSWDLDRVDIALIGDQHVHGVCVRDEDQIASGLRSRWTTLNLGGASAGPLRELGILREFARLQRPRVVVWLYFEGDDPGEFQVESRTDWLAAYLDLSWSQGLADEAATIDPQYQAWLDSLFEQGPNPLPDPNLARLLREVPRLGEMGRALGVHVAFPRRGSALGRIPDVLRLAREEVEAWGGELVVAYLPAPEQYELWTGTGSRAREEMTEFARREGIRLLDLDSAFRETGSPRDLWTPLRDGLTASGHRLVGEAIAAVVDSLLGPS